MENPKNDIEKRTLTLVKTFDAPLKAVWQAWSNPDHIAHWWAPREMEFRIVEHDFRIGGKWKYSMPLPNGNEFISEGIYSDIVEMEKITSSADFRPMTEDVAIRVAFENDGDKTKITFKVIHPTEEYCRQQEKTGFYKGWDSAFKRLEDFLKRKSR